MIFVALKVHKNQHRTETWFKPSFAKKFEADPRVASGSSSEDDDDSSSSSSDEDTSYNEDENNSSVDESSEKTAHINEKKLSTSELNKRFMHNYLNTIGKLFTKVGMETYQEVCSRMLHEFNELLRRQPCPFGKIRLLQITVINLSVMDLIYKSSNININSCETIRTQLIESSIQLSIDMFVLIVKRFNKSLAAAGGVERSWCHLFPSIKVFIDWMLSNSKLWQPLPDQLSPDLGPNPNRLQIIADMLNLVSKLRTNYISFSQSVVAKIALEEDLELAGFVPLLLLPSDAYEMNNKEKTNDILDLDENTIEHIKASE